MATRPTTRGETRARLAEQGVTGPAVEVYLDATGRDRHASRVARFVECALAEAEHATGIRSPSYGVAVLVLEAFGVVDASGPTETSAKVHHRAFRSGCGARTGPAAGAHHAACRGALDELWRRAAHRTVGAPHEVVLRPAARAIEVVAPPLRPVRLDVEHGAKEAQPAGWLAPLALEALRRVFGETPWFELGAERQPGPHEERATLHVLQLIRFEGDAGTWGDVLDVIAARRRVETMSRSIAAVVDDAPLGLPPYLLNPRATLAEVEAWIGLALGPEGGAVVELARTPTVHASEVEAALRAALARRG